MRDRDAAGLAQYVLRDCPEWTREKILATMNGDKPVTVTLKNHIRVFIVYGTAIATQKGNLLVVDATSRPDEGVQSALRASARQDRVYPIGLLPSLPQPRHLR